MTVQTSRPAARGPARRAEPSHRRLRWVAALIGVAAALVGYAGAGIPSYWGDEAASVMSAERSWLSLFAELSEVDAVHGLYYAFLHLWVEVFGAGEWSTRAPSAIAIGFLAVGTVVLGARWFTPRVGVIAGIVCAVLPRTTYLAIEARSYAMAAAAAVWLTIALVALLRRRRSEVWRWALYGLALALSVVLFLYLALLPLVHAVMLAASRPRPERRVIRAWLLSTAGAAVLAAPFAVVSLLQSDQLSYLAFRDWARLDHVLGTQWFDEPVVAVIGWALAVVGIASAFLERGRFVAPQPAIWPVLAWVVLPTAALLLVDGLVTKTYSPRYLSWCVAAIAMLIALGIDGLATAIVAFAGWQADASRLTDSSQPSPAPPSSSAGAARLAALIAALAVGALAIAALPAYLGQRGETGKDGGADFRQVADYIREHAHPGDAVVFGTADRRSREPRLALRLYPDAFAGLDDVQLRTPYDERAALWDEVVPLDEVASDLHSDVVWVIDPAGAAPGWTEQRMRATDPEVLEDAGYERTNETRIHRTVVARYERER